MIESLKKNVKCSNYIDMKNQMAYVAACLSLYATLIKYDTHTPKLINKYTRM